MTSQRFIWRNRNLHLSINSVRLSITLEGTTDAQVHNYDLAGRPWNIYKEGCIHQRGLNGKVVVKWTNLETGRGRRWLKPIEADTLVKDASELAASILDDIRSKRITIKLEDNPDLINALEAAATFSGQRAQQEVTRFHEIYSPLGILPPDQYQAVLLQATEGCSFNTCTFCELYKGQSFTIKTEDDFRDHARAVREFLGAGLSLRRTLFLGDANALVIPTERLLRMMRIAGEFFDVNALGGFYAFLDGFSGERKSSRDFRRLREAGLERIYIGLESGHDALLRFLNKPGVADDALNAVRKMKTGGVPVGIIILLGAGGQRFAKGHVQDTVRLINEMKLDLDDQIYLSELIEFEDMQYAKNAFREDIVPLGSTQILHQANTILSMLNFNLQHGTPHISRYDIREFVY
jgi:hypothetical protein